MIFWLGDALGSPVGHRRRGDERVGGQRGLDRLAHLARRTDMNDLSPDGIGQADRPSNEGYPCAGAELQIAQLHVLAAPKNGFR